MKRIFVALMMICALLALNGCGGGGDDSRPLITQEIFSDPLADGEIQFTPPNSFTIRQNIASLFAGLNPANEDEFRAFLDFPLNSVPLNASIQAADLDIVIRSVTLAQPAASVPIRIEMVDYPPLALAAADFDSAPVLPTAIVRSISSAGPVLIDVTPFVVAAQARGLANLQLRILQDFGPFPPGLIEIDDDLDPPLLFVDFF